MNYVGSPCIPTIKRRAQENRCHKSQKFSESRNSMPISWFRQLCAPHTPGRVPGGQCPSAPPEVFFHFHRMLTLQHRAMAAYHSRPSLAPPRCRPTLDRAAALRWETAIRGLCRRWRERSVTWRRMSSSWPLQVSEFLGGQGQVWRLSESTPAETAVAVPRPVRGEPLFLPAPVFVKLLVASENEVPAAKTAALREAAGFSQF